MKKTILALTAVSLGIVFTACEGTQDMSVEQRLQKEYGWKGGALPKPAPDETVIVTEKDPMVDAADEKDAGLVSSVEVSETVVSETEKTDGKNTGIVSTVEVSETVIPGTAEADGKNPVKAGSPDSKDSAGKTVTTLQPPPPANSGLPGETKTHLVKQGESLWTIAVKEYKNGNKWSVIYKANKALLKENPNSIRPGMKLIIPDLNKAAVEKNTTGSEAAPEAKPIPTEKKAEPLKPVSPAAEKSEQGKDAASTVTVPPPVPAAPAPPVAVPVTQTPPPAAVPTVPTVPIAKEIPVK